jgi:hypothetical protein
MKGLFLLTLFLLMSWCWCAFAVSDLEPVDRFVVNLDLPPEDRWTHILSLPKYYNLAQSVYQTLLNMFPTPLQQILLDIGTEIGDDLETYIHEPYASEMKGLAKVLNFDVGDIVLVNLFYEFTAFCTSIVAQTNDGVIYHARNLDLGWGTDFTTELQNLTIQVEFQQNNQTIYIGTTYAAYIGLVTGMKPGVFAVTVNERDANDYIGNLLKALEDLLFSDDAVVLSFFLRDQLASATSYSQVKQTLITQPLIAQVYLILSGVEAGEGSVITRDRDGAVDVWNLDAPEEWFLLETNEDHWLPPSPRRATGIKEMEKMGRQNMTFDGLLNVLSTKPVLNSETTYSALISARTLYYQTFKRTCPKPC